MATKDISHVTSEAGELSAAQIDKVTDESRQLEADELNGVSGGAILARWNVMGLNITVFDDVVVVCKGNDCTFS